MKTIKTLFTLLAAFSLVLFAGNSIAAAAEISPIIPIVGLGSVTAFSFFAPEKLNLVTMNMGTMSLRELRAQADKLSNFGGANFGYTGEQDDLLSFAGSIQNFAGELVEHLEKQFVVTIVNANASKRTAVLFAGYTKGNATLTPGQLIEGAFNDTGGNAGLTGATASEKSIEEMLLYLNVVPTRLLAIKVKSTVASQIDENFTYQRFNPFQTMPTKILRPGNFQNQDTYQDKVATFPANVQLDNQAKLTCPVVGSSTITLSFFFGTSINLALTLERKAVAAYTNINSMGQENVLRSAVAAKTLGQ
jgi:hypothetical protein